MLRLAGLEPRADRRHALDPLVVIGGAVTFVNPEPLAPFADVIAAGEAELLVPSIVDAFADDGDRDRPALLERLATETRLLRAEPVRRRATTVRAASRPSRRGPAPRRPPWSGRPR